MEAALRCRDGLIVSIGGSTGLGFRSALSALETFWALDKPRRVPTWIVQGFQHPFLQASLHNCTVTHDLIASICASQQFFQALPHLCSQADPANIESLKVLPISTASPTQPARRQPAPEILLPFSTSTVALSLLVALGSLLVQTFDFVRYHPTQSQISAQQTIADMSLCTNRLQEERYV